MLRQLFFIILCCICLASYANQVLTYEPTDVSLQGSIIFLTFPGPPNYENIKKGDKAEKGPYLILSQPIDVQLPKSADQTTNEPQNNVKLIQLIVLNQADWQAIKSGNDVQINGTLSSAITGHHHARVLMTVNKIKVLSNRKRVNTLDQLTPEDKKFIKLH